MTTSGIHRFLETIIIGAVGGFIFYILDTPLPWVLGAITFVMLWQNLTKRETNLPSIVRDSGFIVLGLYFGLYFTLETFQVMIGYFIPHLLTTILLIAGAILFGWIVSKWIDVDPVTSILASIPGGLSEMVLASEDMKGNSAYVAIFQTIRLVAVLFIVPPTMVYFFDGESASTFVTNSVNSINSSLWNYTWFIIPVIGAFWMRKKIPAGIIIGALVITAVMNVSIIQLPSIPSVLLYIAQVMVGASIGKNILFKDLKKAGKYGIIYFGITLLIIGLSFLLGTILHAFTSLNHSTAMLSIAPGGLFEMVLTAYSIGGDPAVVSSLQLIRILVIVTCVPPLLKWIFSKKHPNNSITKVKSEIAK